MNARCKMTVGKEGSTVEIVSLAKRMGKLMNQLLASVNIFVDPSQKDQVLTALEELKNIEEIYEVTGEYDIVSLVSASCLEEFRDVLQKKIMKIVGIKSTITTIILQPYKGPRCLVAKTNTSVVK